MKFTYESYTELLRKLQRNGYHIVNYENWNEYDRSVILRHDIDYDIKKAVDLAMLEKETGGGYKATYFVLLTSDFYNVFSKKNVDALRQIVDCGHTIGLHFDEVRYPEIAGNPEKIKSKIIEERKLLSVAVGQDIKCVSMHRPGKAILDVDLQIPGMINSYGQKFFKEFKYLSDSRRRWREPVEHIIEAQEYDRLHILTHPFWYNMTDRSLHDSIFEFVNNANRSRYNFLQSDFTDLESVMLSGEVL